MFSAILLRKPWHDRGLPGFCQGAYAKDHSWSLPITIQFVIGASHRFFLGGRIEGDRWFPVLVDETTNTLIHPPRWTPAPGTGPSTDQLKILTRKELQRPGWGVADTARST